MDRRHFIGQSAAAVGLLAGLSSQTKAANLKKAEDDFEQLKNKQDK